MLIGGFISGPDERGSANIVVRAIGPSLQHRGVANALQNPALELRDANGALIAANDDWANDAAASQVDGAGLAPEDASESAIYISLPPGSCTAIVRGANDQSGVALVEIYRLAEP